ncbi:polymer-forming cytoskeletal protein [bacterium SCSIO 12643]|nr:polymer-forming cytoskeletal protein [bacterium SCSIO 12643]
MEFTGTHIGEINVSAGFIFILRGELIGNLHISKGSEVIIFGKIKGKIYSDEILDIRKGSKIEGTLSTIGIKIQNGASLNGITKNYTEKNNNY